MRICNVQRTENDEKCYAEYCIREYKIDADPDHEREVGCRAKFNSALSNATASPRNLGPHSAFTKWRPEGSEPGNLGQSSGTT